MRITKKQKIAVAERLRAECWADLKLGGPLRPLRFSIPQIRDSWLWIAAKFIKERAAK